MIFNHKVNDLGTPFMPSITYKNILRKFVVITQDFRPFCKNRSMPPITFLHITRVFGHDFTYTLIQGARTYIKHRPIYRETLQDDYNQ